MCKGVRAVPLAPSKGLDLVNTMLKEAQVEWLVLKGWNTFTLKLWFTKEIQRLVGVQDVQGVRDAEKVVLVPSPIALHVRLEGEVGVDQMILPVSLCPQSSKSALQ